MPKKELRISEVFFSLQGEGTLSGVPSVFIRLAGCNVGCKWCVAEGTLVLMADWSWRPIERIEIGDRVFGARKRSTGFVEYTPTTVQLVHDNGVAETVNVETPDGDVLQCTPDHKVLAFDYRRRWYQARSLVGKTVRLLPVGEIVPEFRRGWISGFLAGNGNFHEFRGKWMRLKATSIDSEVLDRLQAWCAILGLDLRRIPHRTKGFTDDPEHTIPAAEVTKDEEVRQFQLLIDDKPFSFDYARGWLGGFFDAEGATFDTCGGTVRISQSHEKNPDKITKALAMVDLVGLSCSAQELSNGMTTLCISPPGEFFSLCRPSILRKYPSSITLQSGKYSTIQRVAPAGEFRVWDLTTGTGNYIANGFVVHNCDTAYSWSGGEPWAFKRLRDEIDKYECSRMVITGGEPLLQADALNSFIHRPAFDRHKWHTTIETAGTISPPQGLLYDIDLWSVSPKLPSAEAKIDVDLAVINQYVDHYVPEVCGVQFKFVINAHDNLESDMRALRHFLAAVPGIRERWLPVVLQPCALDITDSNAAEFPITSSEWGKTLWEAVQKDWSVFKAYDIRVLLQLHKLYFGMWTKGI